MINTGTRSPVLLVVSAAVGLGALAMAQFNNIGPLMLGRFEDDVLVYSPFAAVVLALLAWHLSPRWSWVVLVVLGALCTVPTAVLLMPEGDAIPSWAETPYLVVSSVASPLLLVGLLGAATVAWRTGRRDGGAALIGATVAMPALASLIVATLVFGVGTFVPVIGLVLIAATIILAIAAAVTGPRPAQPQAQPSWRVTVAGAVAGVAPLVYHFWRGPDAYRPAGDAGAYYEQAGQHLLAVGLIVLGVALLAGLLTGARVLVAAVAAGLLLAAVADLGGPAAINLRDLPVGIPAMVAIVAVAAGAGIALLRARVLFGVVGLGVVIVGLAVVWLALSVDSSTRTLTLILLAIAAIAAIPLLTSLGSVVTSAGEAPATFAGIVAGVVAGVSGILGYFEFTGYGDESTAASTVVPVMVSLGCAAGLAVLAHYRWRRVPVTDPQFQ